MTIASRDGDHSSGSMIGFARARNNMVKTPIVVKRTEPGKEPVLSDPKVTVQKATGAQQVSTHMSSCNYMYSVHRK